MAATEKSNDLGGLEKSLEELEALVARLESGDLPLEQALKEFEHGVQADAAVSDGAAGSRAEGRDLAEEDGHGRAEPVRTAARIETSGHLSAG